MQQSAALDANQDRTTSDPAEDRIGLPAASRAGVHQGRSMLHADHDATSRPALPQVRRPIVRHVAAQAGGAPRNLRHRYGQRSQPCGRRRRERSACRGLDHSARIQACRDGDTGERLRKLAADGNTGIVPPEFGGRGSSDFVPKGRGRRIVATSKSAEPGRQQLARQRRRCDGQD
jgi:hypothetical protein